MTNQKIYIKHTDATIFADASITGTATVTSSGIAVRLADADVTGSASVTALGGFEASGSAIVTGTATVVSSATRERTT